MFRFDPYSPAIDADPFPFLPHAARRAPLLLEPEAQMWVLSRYADIVSAGQDWQTYSSARGNLMTELPNRAGATLGTTDPPRHDRLRGLVQHAFMKRNLESLAEPIRDIARRGHRRWQASPVRLHRRLFVQVHRARAVRRAGPAAGRRARRRCARRRC
jgi:cytochrome P450